MSDELHKKLSGETQIVEVHLRETITVERTAQVIVSKDASDEEILDAARTVAYVPPIVEPNSPWDITGSDGLDVEWDDQEDEEDEEDEEERDASEECYYHDAKLCRGETWECETCGETFCDFHFHDTDKGHNVECVACERSRKDAEREDE